MYKVEASDKKLGFHIEETFRYRFFAMRVVKVAVKAGLKVYVQKIN